MHGTSCRLGEGGGRFQRQGRCDQLSSKHARVTPDTSAYTESPPKSLSWICGPRSGGKRRVSEGKEGEKSKKKTKKSDGTDGRKNSRNEFLVTAFFTPHPPSTSTGQTQDLGQRRYGNISPLPLPLYWRHQYFDSPPMCGGLQAPFIDDPCIKL